MTQFMSRIAGIRTAGLAQPAASLACSDWSEGTSDGHGWIGSKAVETTGGRVGQAVDQDVQLREI
jgi:hypothetical protein